MEILASGRNVSQNRLKQPYFRLYKPLDFDTLLLLSKTVSGCSLRLYSIREILSGTLTDEGFYAGLIALAVFLPVITVIAQSYFYNRLVFTDRRIYIRKGISGRSHVLDREDIRSFQHAYSRGRNSTNHRILFYLKNGRTVKTGELYATLGSLQDLLALLREHYEGRGFTTEELREMRERDPVCRSTEKINVFRLLVTLAPFILAVGFAGYYLLER